MLRPLLLSGFLLLVFAGKSQDLRDRYLQNKTGTYEEVIGFYRSLDEKFEEAKLFRYGSTDSGEPLHLFLISREGIFTAEEARRKGKLVMLVMNGIHPGESCGIDASLNMAAVMLEKKSLPGNIILAIIPVYNIGGAKNRGCCSRANQDGPEEYGFRGNSRLLDLNRDFIKMDSRNAFAFVRIFREWDPHIFVDTHTTDGADYQYAMTIIPTQEDKLGGEQGIFLREEMLPALTAGMDGRKEPVIPYVNVFKTVPDSGFAAFLETPRYSTGYAALFQCIGFVTEAHMLKPYPKRVEATRTFLEVLLDYADRNTKKISGARTLARKRIAGEKELPVEWSLVPVPKKIPFRAFQASYRTSSVTGRSIVHYDREKPVTITVDYFDRYEAVRMAKVPSHYIVPFAWREVIERLEANGVEMMPLKADTVIRLGMHRVEKYETVQKPYEGHYLHYAIKSAEGEEEVLFRKGDLLVPTGQPAKRFIVEVLEPDAPDSYFAWNFYDEILQQKEWFSDYVFDPVAEEMLRMDPDLKTEFEKARQQSPDSLGGPYGQLYFIYRRSPMMEKTFMRYPVGKIFSP